MDKPLYVLHGTIRTPPMSGPTRVEVGYNLRRLQHGETLAMPLSRPLPSVGPNCHELRIGDIDIGVEWRVVYCIDEVAILVLEVFKKETRETPERIKKACRERLQRYLRAKEGK